MTHVTNTPTPTHIRRLSNLATLLLRLLLHSKVGLPLSRLAAPIPMLRTAAIKTMLPCGTLHWLLSKVASHPKVSSAEVRGRTFVTRTRDLALDPCLRHSATSTRELGCPCLHNTTCPCAADASTRCATFAPSADDSTTSTAHVRCDTKGMQ